LPKIDDFEQSALENDGVLGINSQMDDRQSVESEEKRDDLTHKAKFYLDRNILSLGAKAGISARD
jgi:hypothetical protein